MLLIITFLKIFCTVFDDKPKGELKSSKEEVDSHYRKRYEDEMYEDMPKKRDSMQRPTQPMHQFMETFFSKEEFMSYLRKTKNSSTPGPNGIPYLVLQKMPLHQRLSV